PSFLSSSVFSAPSTSQTSTLSLHDALPIFRRARGGRRRRPGPAAVPGGRGGGHRARRALGGGLAAVPDAARARWRGRLDDRAGRSEEHTSELQSRRDLVCRLLLEKKKKSIKAQRCRLAASSDLEPSTPQP